MSSRRPSHKRHADSVHPPRSVSIKIGDIVRIPFTNGTTTYGVVRTTTPVHVQYLQRAEATIGPNQAGRSNEFSMVDAECATIRRRDILQRVRGSARLVTACGVWRDPKKSVNGCDSCGAKAARAKTKKPTLVPNGFKVGGKVFHLGDFACVSASAVGEPWRVGLISLINFPRVEVRLCMRYSDLDDARRSYVSEREIVLTDCYDDWTAGDIVGKASVNIGDERDPNLCDGRNVDHDVVLHVKKRLPEGVTASRHMLVPLRRRDLPRCEVCRSAADDDDNGDNNADLRLPSIDLYAGGGGSLLGASRHFEVRHAVDSDPVCCATLEQNRGAFFPRLIVHQNTVAVMRRKQAPRRGNVALMVAGPPCQGHSRANHFRHRGDARNDEINVTLDEVTRLRPYVFVLENVPGIKDDNDGHNYLLEIVRRLLATGYQVRVGALNAADYGAPQARLRYIVLATRLGIPLPSFPPPTHSSAAPRSTCLPIPNGKVRSFSLFPAHGSAPLRGVTAKDALHDLPAWNYDDYPPAAQGFAQGFIGREVCAYASTPQNDYQRRARTIGGRQENVLRDHVTARRSERELDYIYFAPRAGSETDLPSNEQRLRPHEPIPTLLTSSRPGGKGRSTIHYACHRSLTVAERKRAQGIPDAYRLAGSVAEKDRILGNAINVHLMDAVCRQIKAEVFAPLWRELGKPDSDTFWTIWKQHHP